MNDAVRAAEFRLAGVRAERLSLELADSLVTGTATHTEREVVIVRVRIRANGRDVSGIGEASPMPGWGAETVDEVRQALHRVDGPAPTSIDALDRAYPWLRDTPVTRFGLETALLDALARAFRRPLYALLARDAPAAGAESVAVQYTMGIEPASVCIERLTAARRAGFSHAKLKVGDGDPGADVERIRRITDAVAGMMFRLDANGAWTLEQALAALHALPAQRVEFVEQPVRDTLLPELLSEYDGAGPRVAADESCSAGARARALIRSGRLGAAVIKPAAVGGLLAAADLARLAARSGVQVVFSNLMESAVGRAASAHLAAAHPGLPGPHGLATGGWLAHDVVPDPDRIASGRLWLRPGHGLGFDVGEPA